MLPVVPTDGWARALDTGVLPLPAPSIPGCAPPPPACPPSKPGLPTPPEVLEDDDIPNLAASIGIFQADLLASVVSGETQAERIVLINPLPGRSPPAAVGDAAGFAGEAPRPELGVLLYPWLRILDPLAPGREQLARAAVRACGGGHGQDHACSWSVGCSANRASWASWPPSARSRSMTGRA